MQDYKDKVNKLKPTKSTLLSIAFVILALFFAAFAASGFRFDLEFYKRPEFWTQTFISYGLMMIAYTIFKKTTIRTEMYNPNSDFSKSKKRYDSYIATVRNKHLEYRVESAVDVENETRRKKACQKRLDEITYNLRLEDLDNFTDKDFEAYCLKYRLTKKEKKRLYKAIKDAMNSKVEYEKLKVNDILIYSDKNKSQDEADYKINTAKMDARESARKTVMFLLSTSITSALVWKGVGPEFWLMLLTHATLIISSIISAMFSAYARLAYLTAVLDNRCGFLNVALSEETNPHNNQNDL